MSIIMSCDAATYIDHSIYLDNIYSAVKIDEQQVESYRFCNVIFDINRPFKDVKNNRKRKKNDIIDIEAMVIKDVFSKMLKESGLKNKVLNEVFSEVDLKQISRTILDVTSYNYGDIAGGNSSEFSIKCKINDDYFILPPKSRFLCGCVKKSLIRLRPERFNLIMADPPWWNKYIRNLKHFNEDLSYQMMYNEELANLPISSLLADNCLIAVWCTNSPSNIDALKSTIFPAWGVDYITTWYWMKVTKTFEPVCKFNSKNKKQPYERLLIGKVGELKCIPQADKVVMSVPSAIHSHKPPLLDLLKPFIPEGEVKALELFARYLLLNTTSLGFEPLKFQHFCLFSKKSEDK